MFKLEIKLGIVCIADVSEECASTWPAREAEFYCRLKGFLDRGDVRDALADAGFDVLYNYISNITITSS